jgi:ferredoxin
MIPTPTEQNNRQNRTNQRVAGAGNSPKTMGSESLRQICLEAGADDVGFVEIDRNEIADQREAILSHFPWTRTLIGFVCRMNREPIRSTERAVANLEFHESGGRVNHVSRTIVAQLERMGIRAVNPSMGFPMEMTRYPGKIWTVSHKPVAEAAGLGKMGIHRNIIHPKFGNFILLGTVLTEASVTEPSRPIDGNPCLECKLCVAACPVGAIGDDGRFNFSACVTHNYREFMGGFQDWTDTLAGSGQTRKYREKFSNSETASIWQSLSFGPNYKAAYCMSVCPAGEDVIDQYLSDKKKFVAEVVRPVQKKEETVYVVAGSDAEDSVPRRFPHKTVKPVPSGLTPTSVHAFLQYLPHLFQRNKSKGLDAVYHFTFSGEESAAGTVTIRNQKVEVQTGLAGKPDIHITADSRTWLRFLAKEENIVWALIRRKVRVKGPIRLMKEFGKCFPV